MKTNLITWIKSKVSTLVIVAVLFSASSLFAYLYFQEKANSKRLWHNIETLKSESKSFTTRDGHTASKADVLILKPGELKKAFPEVTTSLKNLYIRPAQAESFTETGVSVNFKVAAANRDTLIQIPVLQGEISQPQPAKTFNYTDKWKSVNGLIFPDTTFVQVAAVDSIFTAIYRGDRRHPALWILSKRKLQVAATNRNPDIQITVIQGGLIKH